MPTLDMTITDAGRAAIIAASGVDPVTITEIAVGDSGYTPAPTQTALVNEIKRLTTVVGTVSVPDDTISLNVTDESGDTYTLREFGLYSDAGTLIAVYAQASPIAEKSSGSTLALAADIVLESLDAASVTFGDTNFLFPAATATVSGIVELADLPEARAGTDSSRVLTPQGGQALMNRYGLGGAGYDSDIILTGSKSFSDPLLYQRNGIYAVSGTWQDGPDGVSTYVGTLNNVYSGADGLSSVVQYLNANGQQYIRTATIATGVPTWGSWFFNYSSESFLLNTEMPAGIPHPWPLETPPGGWLSFNGSAFSIPSFPQLGLAYPSGILVDLRGEFIRGWDNGRGVDVGRSILTWQAQDIQPHAHQFTAYGSDGGNAVETAAAGVGVSHVQVTSTSGTVETRPRNVAFNYIARAR